MKLTPKLKGKIVDAARSTQDFDAVEAATGVSYSLLNEWIQRGLRQKKRGKSGIHRELVEELKPFYAEMSERKFRDIVMRLFKFLSPLVSMAEKDKRVERVLTVWYAAIWLNNPKVSNETRKRLATEIATALGRPIHPGRWHHVEGEVDRISRSQGRSRQLVVNDLEVQAVFRAADLLKAGRPEDPPGDWVDQIFGDYKTMRRIVNDLLTEDLAGTEWRQFHEELAEESTPSLEDQFRQMSELHTDDELREFVYQRLALMAKTPPDRLQALVQRRKISTINALADKLGVDRTDLYRTVIFPAREFKVKKLLISR